MKKKVFIIISIIVALLIVSLLIFGFVKGRESNTSNTTNLKEYAEELLNIDLKDYVVSEKGEIHAEPGEEEYSYISFKLADGSKDKVEEMLTNACGEKIPVEDYIIPGYMGHYLANQMKSQELKSIYQRMQSGKYAKTRTTSCYLTVDSNGTNWLYIFG